MFKLYQATQKRMNDGLVEALNSRIIFLVSFAASEVFILTFILVVWLIRLKAKNLALA